MDIDTDQLKAALDSDILILDCRRDGEYRIIFLCFLQYRLGQQGHWKVTDKSKIKLQATPHFVQPLTWMFLFLNFYKSFKNAK